MGFADLNWLAVAAAAVAGFLVGGLWYSPLLFSKPWMALAYPGRTMEDLKREGRGAGPGYALAFAGAFLSAATLAYIAAAAFPEGGLVAPLRAALYVAIGFLVPAFGMNYFFGGRPLALWAIDVGHHVASLVVMGLVLGAWP